LEIIETKFEGLHILKPKIFGDERGYFFESFNQQKFQDLTGTKTKFVQDNQSLSQKNVLRGMHFQKPPFAQAKLVRVISGAVLDVVVDIRKKSKNFGEHFCIELTNENQLQLFIPEGFAHGFLTLQENTIFSYKCSDYYHPETEGTIFWNDPDLKINWGVHGPLVSEKDMKGEYFRNFISPF